MTSILTNRLGTAATARRMIVIPLLVFALAFATMTALPHGTAYADGGQTTTMQQGGAHDDINTAQCLLPGIPC